MFGLLGPLAFNSGFASVSAGAAAEPVPPPEVQPFGFFYRTATSAGGVASFTVTAADILSVGLGRYILWALINGVSTGSGAQIQIFDNGVQIANNFQSGLPSLSNLTLVTIANDIVPAGSTRTFSVTASTVGGVWQAGATNIVQIWGLELPVGTVIE
jgi:hypothetical protein